MKKKSLFSGFNAKLALTVVALSGALLTGCYKDEGLDVNGPAGEVTLPAPVYTIAGTVVDAETLAPIASANVAGGVTAIVKDGGFTAKVDDPNVYTFTVSATNYEDTKVTVNVEEIKAGQTAIYPAFVAMQPKYEGTYKLVVKDTELGNLVFGTDYTIQTVAGTAVTDINAVRGGETYVIKIEKAGYVTKYVTVELLKLRSSESGKDKTVIVTLTETPVGVVKISGVQTVNGTLYNAKAITLKDSDNKILGVDEGYTYNFEVPANLFAVETRADSEKKSATFTFVIVGPNNETITFTKKIEITSDGTSDSEVESPIEYKVNLSTPAVEEKIDEFFTKATIDICNDNEPAGLAFNITYTDFIGTVVVEGDYADKLAELGLKDGNPIYNQIVSLMATGVTEKFAEERITVNSEKDLNYVIPYDVWLKTAGLNRVYNQVTREIADITVNDVQVVGTLEGLFGAKNVVKEAKGIAFNGDWDWDTVSHAHAHGHGHGSGNAGGGIIIPE